MLVQMLSKMVYNWWGMVPNTSSTLLEYLWGNKCIRKKTTKQLIRLHVLKPICWIVFEKQKTCIKHPLHLACRTARRLLFFEAIFDKNVKWEKAQKVTSHQ